MASDLFQVKRTELCPCSPALGVVFTAHEFLPIPKGKAASDITEGGGQEIGAIVKVSKGSGRIQNPLKGK